MLENYAGGEHRARIHGVCVLALRVVPTRDFMAADGAELLYGLLKRTSGRIIEEMCGIDRVIYGDSNKPPATLGWE